MASDKWTYGENKEWVGQCLLENQSPINIDTELIQQCRDLCDIKFKYLPSRCSVEFIKDENLKLIYDKGSGIVFNNNYFKLKEIIIHTPSLHHIDGNIYDMEICLIHSLSDSPYDRDGIVVSILYKEGNYFGSTENFMNQFVNEIKIDNKETVDVSDDWGANMLIPKNKSFFMYSGSLMFPPCSKMTHIVMDTIGNIGPTNLELLSANLGKNIRSLQPLGARHIYYNPGIISKNKTRDILKSNDKFLRCKKKKTNIKQEDPPVKTESPPIDSVLSIETKQRIKNISIFVNILTLMINSFFLTKYLFKYEIAQKMITMLVGYSKLGNPNILTIWRTDESCSKS